MPSKVTHVSTSAQFKKMATKAIISIVVFLLTYILLVAAAIGLAILLGYFGLALISLYTHWFTIVCGIGIVSIGLLVLFFLVKFIFSSNKVDRDGMIEIKEKDAPRLFAMLKQLVEEVDTHFPKKVYLSPEVNACVFYSSSFWSMFFPVRKNLQIGLGLVNAVTVTELKAILAHEFGHFSQSSMKLGNYVYNVNKVLYDLLYNNEGYSKLASKWGSINQYIGFFVMIAIEIVKQIQELLKFMYGYVNKSYMALSREMEFHADEIAANVTGSKPLIDSLLRLDIANTSYNTVINHYNDKIKQNKITDNIFQPQRIVLQFLAKESKIKVENDLPNVSLQDYTKFNKSKLVIKDQWASHPTTEERVFALEKLNKPVEQVNNNMAFEVFDNFIDLEKTITKKVYETVPIPDNVVVDGVTAFENDFTEYYKSNSFNEIYKGYYSSKNPLLQPVEKFDIEAIDTKSFDELFSDDNIEKVNLNLALTNDLAIISDLINQSNEVKSLDYDGVKYQKADFGIVKAQLQKALEQSNHEIRVIDEQIFKYFYKQAFKKNSLSEWLPLHNLLVEFDGVFEQHKKNFENMRNDVLFTMETHTYEKIEELMAVFKRNESTYKIQINALFKHENYLKYITSENCTSIECYLKQDYLYFNGNAYDDAALQVLFTAQNAYYFSISDIYFGLKKQLLNFQVDLIER